MSKFFDSSIIREEMEEIFNIQKELYQVIMQFGSMDDQEKREHMEKLKTTPGQARGQCGPVYRLS